MSNKDLGRILSCKNIKAEQLCPRRAETEKNWSNIWKKEASHKINALASGSDMTHTYWLKKLTAILSGIIADKPGLHMRQYVSQYSIAKKAQQCLFFLVRLRKAHLPLPEGLLRASRADASLSGIETAPCRIRPFSK